MKSGRASGVESGRAPGTPATGPPAPGPPSLATGEVVMRRTLLWTVSLLIATPPATAAAAPVISVSPSIRNYGNVNVGSNSPDFIFVVGNNGSDILTVTSQTI